MIGQRIECPFAANGGLLAEWPAAGTYWLSPHGWMCVTPNRHMGNLSAHDVTEHEDGTITVSPSILVSVPSQHPADWSWTKSGPEYPVRGEELWHGFLERGVWRQV